MPSNFIVGQLKKFIKAIGLEKEARLVKAVITKNYANTTDSQEPAGAYPTQGRYEDAMRKCAQALHKDPANARLLFQMGQLHQWAKNTQEAKRFFNLAIEHASGDQNMMRRVEISDCVATLLPSSRTDIENFFNPDIVLIQAPGWGVNTPPLGTAMLTAYARKHGYKVLPIDLNVEFYLKRPPEFKNTWEMEQSLWFWETSESVERMMKIFHKEIDSFIDLVIATNAPIVGFTIYNSSAHISIELARMLKERQPKLKIIFGGPHVSRDVIGLSVIKNHFIDAVAQGEGELTLIDIIERVKTGQPLTDCPGLIVFVDGRIVETGTQKSIGNLSQIPVPDFSDYAFDLYRTPTRLPVMSSRGCPNQCIYCNERPFWAKFRARAAGDVFAEIQTQISQYPSIDYIDFQDSLVNGKIHELERLAELIIESGLKIQWSGQAVIRKEMTIRLMSKLKQSGCICLAYGLEAPSESLMLSIGKLLSKGADMNAITQAHAKSGLGVTYNFMFGLPGETEEDAFAVHEFLRRNKDSGMSVNPSSCFCYFGPGTPAYDNPEKYGIDLSKGGLFWESTDGRNTYITRLKRFEDFCRIIHEFGIFTTYPSTFLLDRNRTLGNYYAQSGDEKRARWYYEAWLEKHPDDYDIRASLDKLSPNNSIEPDCYQTSHYTDQNWVNGVATSWATALFLPSTVYAKSRIVEGRQITFADGATRTIVSAKEDNGSLIVHLDGAPLDGTVVGYPQEFAVH